ncbi:DapH/DapD/GlmU-related protein [Vibrio breoganii]|uniref:DapH/DapD/GlmU-related protein n=1 Tax=Vibrio breoganii TaxID=553239 RepID=UPI000C82C9A3|nr:DapH/DapD/GlmU-related protein [Vibrio breoganii]PMJ45290.1 acetyltransferase [Vibrio breoganii]
MKGYDLFGLFNLTLSLLYTKIFYRKCRLIRLPISIRNKNKICFGKRFTTGRYCRIDVLSTENKKIIKIGSNCQINDGVHIAAIESITIGNDVLIASRVFITDHQHGSYSGIPHSNASEPVNKRKLSSDPVLIGNNVWIGEGVVILPGITISEDSIVGANSVVTKDVDKGTIVAGNPARVIKKFNYETETWEIY